MKSRIILVLWLGMSAWAQSAPHPQTAPASAPSKPAADTSRKPATAANAAAPQKPAAPAKPAPAQAKSASTPAKPVAAPPMQQKPAAPAHLNQAKASRVYAEKAPTDSVDAAIRKTLKRKAALDANGVAKKELTTAKWDPFVSRIVERKLGGGSTCTGSGRQCLAVGDIALHGVVEYSGGLLAVVVNGERTYFLREHDPLADGEVVRITRDSIVMSERFSDEFGRKQNREVTKRIGAPTV
jgi:hypothetical protein